MKFNRSNTTLTKSGIYSKILKNRSGSSISLETTVSIPSPTELMLDDQITEKSVLWTQGTKMWKLAADHYGDGRLYWVIGLYNEKPTDAHWEIGDLVHIPFPLEYVISYLRG